MPSTLLVGPPGDVTREPFFARVVGACRDPEKALGLRYLVPTARRRAHVEALLLAACDDGDAICLPRIQTLDAFARDIYVATASSRLIFSRAAAMAIEHVLSEAPGDFPVLLAGRTTPFSGLVEALAGMVRELKRHARLPTELAGVARESARARECAEVWRRYEAFLATHRWADLQDVMLGAASAIQETARRASILAGTTSIIFEGFVEFSPAEERLVRALADAVDTTFVTDRDPAIAGRFRPLPGWLPKAHRRDAPCPFLDVAHIALATREAPAPGLARNVVLIEAPSREDEVEQIASEAKRLLREGYAQRDVAIAVPDLDAYALIIEETFEEHGIPCSAGRAFPLIESPVAAAVLQLLETPARHFDRRDLTALLRSPFLDLGPDASPQTAPIVEELARTMRIFGGKDNWVDGLHARTEHLVRSARQPPPELDDKEVSAALPDDELGRLRLIDALLPRILDLLDGLTEPRSPTAFVASLRGLMTVFRVREQCTAAEAAGKAVPSHTRWCEELLRVLEEIESLDPVLAWPKPMTLDAFVELVRTGIASARVAPPVAQPGIEILDLHDAASRPAKVVFCAGLAEGAVPAAPRRDPLLPSSIRSAIGLPDVARLREDAWIDVYRVLAGASERLVLSRPTADGEAPLLEAPMLTRVRTALGLTPQTRDGRADTRRSLLQALGRSGATAQDAKVLLSSSALEADTSLRGYLHAAHVESIRASAASSSYAGTLSPRVGHEVHRLYDREHEYSATEIERYVRCPFRFFAEYLLRLAEPDETEEDIPAREKGTLLHHIFREFYARWLREHADARIGDDEILTAYGVLAELAQNQCRDEPYTGLLWDKFRERLVGAGDDVPGLLRRFIEVEVETTRGPAVCTPRYLELGFGRQRYRQTLDPASRDEPVAIQAGERTIRLHGVIDRIDLNADTGTYCVLDYKSGSRVPSQKEIESGVSLQLPIYMLAAQDLFGDRHVFAAAGYFQTKDAAACSKSRMIGHADHAPGAVSRDWKKGSLFGEEQLATLLQRQRDIIGRAVDGIESARFAVTSSGPDVAGCSACEYNHLCRYDGITIRTLQERR